MKRVFSIVGARPQFVKLAVVARALAQDGSLLHKTVHTGQHFDDNMSKVFFEDMAIARPDYNLGISSQSHGKMTGRMLEAIEEILVSEVPHIVIVYGDTNSTLAGALAARKLHIDVAHVEAGLRSYVPTMPEEINRVLTDRISNLLFCPTDVAVENLAREGYQILECKIVKTGDVMLDASRAFGEIAEAKSGILDKLGLKTGEFALCTLHRAENTDDPDRFRAIIDGLNRVSDEIPVVMPVHPRTESVLSKGSIGTRFTKIDPLGYLDMLKMLSSCRFVITDSGGLQKEAFFNRKICYTLRAETEWTELVDSGANILVDKEPDGTILEHERNQKLNPSFDFEPYGSGRAGENIAREISSFLTE